MERTTIAIRGMSCGHCVAGVTRALAALEGIEVEKVTVGSATVAHDPRRVPAERIVRAVEEAGYGAEIAGDRS